MAKDYTYFAGSLPTVFWGEKPPVSLADFDTDAQRLLAPEDYAMVQALDLLGDGEAHRLDAVRQYQDFENSLRNAWLDHRKKSRPDAADFRRGYPDFYSEIAPALAQANSAADPLEAEKIIDRLRWNKLDDLSAGHYFDLEYIALYKLKLLIAGKYGQCDAAAGNVVLEEILSALQK